MTYIERRHCMVCHKTGRVASALRNLRNISQLCESFGNPF
jgi:hypothetical protein